MKKFLALLLALMMVLSLAACGSAPAEDEDKGAADTGTVEETGDAVSVEVAIPEATFADLANGGFVVADNDQCKITITDVKEGLRFWSWNSNDGDYIEDRTDGFTLVVSIENKLTDKPIGFECTQAAVNGLCVSAFFFNEDEPEPEYTGNEEFYYGVKDIQPGETISYMVNVSDDYLSVMDTADISVISSYFEILEKDESGKTMNSRGERILTREFLFTLYRDSKEVAVYYERPAKDNDIVLYEDSCVTVTAVSDYEPEHGDALILFLENRADQGIIQYRTENQLINGEITSDMMGISMCNMIKNSCGYMEVEAIKAADDWDGLFTSVDFETIESWEFDFVYVYGNTPPTEQHITLTRDNLQKLYGIN